MSELALAPGIPPDYYDRIAAAEDRHWWYVGMRDITRSLLGEPFARGAGRLLDAGCGTGGFLRWSLDEGQAQSLAGIDIGATAVELARARVPEAELRVGALRDLPFDDGAFDLVVSNDVLQHVEEQDVDRSLSELRRVLVPGGRLLVRTNGSRRLRRERDDWRAYDRKSLRSALERNGLACERVTYANALLSLVAWASGRTPHAPSESSHGIVMPEAGRLKTAVGRRVLSAEAAWLARPGRTLPFGHTLFAVAAAR
jgi:ubiquinone/menaquinone biosynthesis C-methylase UbiE